MTGPESRCPHASPGPCAYGRPRGGAGTVASVGKSDSESNWLPQRAGATRSSHKPLGLRWQVMRVTVRWREPAARKGRSCRSGSSSAEPCQCHLQFRLNFRRRVHHSESEDSGLAGAGWPPPPVAAPPAARTRLGVGPAGASAAVPTVTAPASRQPGPPPPGAPGHRARAAAPGRSAAPSLRMSRPGH
jgi:hypothetical protein